MHQGTCLCGTVHYEVDGPFRSMNHCHCSMCRKHHGAAFATFVVAPIAGFRWIAGEDAITAYASTPQIRRSSCSVCGSVTPMLLSEYGVVLIPAGNLAGDPGIKPQAHIFVGSKAPWYTITDTLPQHTEFPPEFPAPATPRPKVEEKAGITAGSCLCGDVEFELDGAPLFMWSCHCTRCRRSRSAAHGTNVFYKAEQLRWTRRESQIMDYKLPEAQFFGSAFCKRCGSALPRTSPGRGIVVVPAGSLDTDPGIRPGAYIFVASKAPWFDITGDIPQHAEMPPRN